MSDSTTAPAPPTRDERLAQLLGELTEQSRQGRPPDLESLARQHPDLASELRPLWGTVQVAEAMGASRQSDRQSNRPEPKETSEADATPGADATRSLGDYELEKEIGRGGMGVVYKARQRSLDRAVAVKMILRGSWASGEDLARFRREAEAAARLHHANIVAVHEVGEHDGQPYFSMEYVGGATLAQMLRDGPLPPREAARILIGVCRAVHHAHQAGVLHRDLKPSNVLMDSDGQPRVTDFGLAKRVTGGSAGSPAAGGTRTGFDIGSLTHSGDIVGTPSYMPPEQAAGSRGELGPSSDVYSLGAILYEMLTGRPPFRAATPLDTLMQVLDQDPVPPRLLNPKADRDLEMICLRCLQKPIDLRYASAAALADPAKGPYFVAELDGQVVGAMQVTTEWSDWRNGWFWWIQGVYVRPEARRRGVFKSLFHHVQEAAKMDPTVIGLRLYVDRGNHRAQGTYERLGMSWTNYGIMERYPL